MICDPLFDFTDRVVLVTGGTRGLGYELVLAFAARGADVVIASRKAENCERVAEEVRALGCRALAVPTHVGRWEQCEALVDAAYAEFGRVDVLINNAGMSPASPSEDVSEKLFDAVIALNFKGPFRLSSLIASRMRAGRGGAVINISSTAALMASPGGSRIITITLEAIINMIDHGMDVQEAIDAPRIHEQWLPDVVALEPFALSADTRRLLEQRGQRFSDEGTWGIAEGIAIGTPRFVAPTGTAAAFLSLAAPPLAGATMFGAHDSRESAGSVETVH